MNKTDIIDTYEKHGFLALDEALAIALENGEMDKIDVLHALSDIIEEDANKACIVSIMSKMKMNESGAKGKTIAFIHNHDGIPTNAIREWNAWFLALTMASHLISSGENERALTGVRSARAAFEKASEREIK